MTDETVKADTTEVKPIAPAVVLPASAPKAEAPPAEAIKPAPEPDPEPTTKERIQEIAAALTHASPSGVETLAGELAGLAEGL